MPPLELLAPDLWIALGVIFISGLMRGFAGFGGAMLVVPVLSILYAPREAVAIAMCLAFLANLQLVPGALRLIQWRVMAPICLAALAAIPFGAMVLLTVDPVWMRRGISVIVLAFVAMLASGWRWRGRPGLMAALAAGGLSGLINGAAGTGGPPVILYLLAGPDPARINRANLIAFYLFLNGGTVASLAFNGVITPEVLWRVLLLTPVFMGAVLAGTRLFLRTGESGYRRFALLLLAGAGLLGLFYPGR